MLKKTLGKTSIEVSGISFGTVSLGLPYGIGVSGNDSMLSEDDSVSLLLTALDKGINFFDTARGYGCSEERIGKAFKGRRNEAVICSKPAHLYDNYKGQSLPEDNTIKKILNESLVQSLSRLQTDYIDVYMSHDGTEEVTKNDTVLDFYQRQKQKGTILATGVSVYTLEEALAAVGSGMWDVVQLQFNLIDQRQLPAIELAKEKGVGIVIRSVLFRGILTDRCFQLHPELKSIQLHREKYLPLVKDGISSLSELATKFAISCDGVSSVLVGIDKSEYMQQALKAISGKHLDEGVLKKLKELAYPDSEFLNLAVWDRKGWLT